MPIDRMTGWLTARWSSSTTHSVTLATNLPSYTQQRRRQIFGNAADSPLDIVASDPLQLIIVRARDLSVVRRDVTPSSNSSSSSSSSGGGGFRSEWQANCAAPVRITLPLNVRNNNDHDDNSKRQTSFSKTTVI